MEKTERKYTQQTLLLPHRNFVRKKADAPAAGNTTKPAKSAPASDGFMNIPDGVDDELPFN